MTASDDGGCGASLYVAGVAAAVKVPDVLTFEVGAARSAVPTARGSLAFYAHEEPKSVMMQHDNFPRLHSPRPPHEPVTTYHFVAKRFVFGPCTVSKQIRVDGQDEARLLVLPADWHDPKTQAWLAREMLWKADCDNHGDIPERFAAEVLATLPHEGWELSFEEVRAWSARHAPPVNLPARPSLDDLAERALRELGELDEDQEEPGR